MNASGLTPYPDVNDVLLDMLMQVRGILGARFVGMYVDGSLALGDFDPASSDIDYVATTNGVLPDELFAALHEMHARFDRSGSTWATEVEAMYIPHDALRRAPIALDSFRIERGEALVKETLDSSWLIHWHILREHSIVVAGPDPRPIIPAIAPDDLRRVVSGLAAPWMDWLSQDSGALRRRGTQIYVVRTLCRMLYTLDKGVVVSKPAALLWAAQNLDWRWAPLIKRAATWSKDPVAQVAPAEVEIDETLAFAAYTFDRCRNVR